MSNLPFIKIEEAKQKCCPYVHNPGFGINCAADECMKWEPKPNGIPPSKIMRGDDKEGAEECSKTHGRCGA